MDIKGVWRPKYYELLICEPEDIGKKKDIDEIMNSGDEEQIEEVSEIAGMRYIFTEDTFMTGIVIPEGTSKEDIDEAVASEGCKVIDGKYLVTQEVKYAADGENFKHELADNNFEGFSEKDIEALKTIKVEDGMLVINAIFGFYYLIRE